MYQPETGGTASIDHQELSSELHLPYDLTAAEFAQLPDTAKLMVGYQTERMQQMFKRNDEFLTALSEVTDLDREKIFAINSQLVKYNKDQVRLAETVRTEEGFRFQLTTDGLQQLDETIGALRFGTV
jgi:hypothetical protein